VIIDASGLVLTNEHVVAGAGDVTVILADRRSFSAEVIGADPAFDIAVLRVVDDRGRAASDLDLPAVELGTSSDLMIGEPVVAIGNPFGLANTVTTGVVSALHRVIEAGDRVYEDFVQIDAAINPGNSGGALLNIEGKLIGVNTAIHSEGVGIGFAIPVDKAKAIVQEVLRYGEVRPAFTGLIVDSGEGPGAVVRAVIPDSPASEAGLRAGDRIVDLGGQEVRDGRSFRQLEQALVPGRSRKLAYVRDGGSKVETRLRIAELDVERVADVGLRRLGLEVAIERRQLVVTRVAPGSDAAQVGIRPGDRLLGLAGRRIRSRSELRALLAAVYDAEQASVLIGRGGRAYTVSLRLGPP
jgi:serine protease Do